MASTKLRSLVLGLPLLLGVGLSTGLVATPAAAQETRPDPAAPGTDAEAEPKKLLGVDVEVAILRKSFSDSRRIIYRESQEANDWDAQLAARKAIGQPLGELLAAVGKDTGPD